MLFFAVAKSISVWKDNPVWTCLYCVTVPLQLGDISLSVTSLYLHGRQFFFSFLLSGLNKTWKGDSFAPWPAFNAAGMPKGQCRIFVQGIKWSILEAREDKQQLGSVWLQLTFAFSYYPCHLISPRVDHCGVVKCVFGAKVGPVYPTAGAPFSCAPCPTHKASGGWVIVGMSCEIMPREWKKGLLFESWKSLWAEDEEEWPSAVVRPKSMLFLSNHHSDTIAAFPLQFLAK